MTGKRVVATKAPGQRPKKGQATAQYEPADARSERDRLWDAFMASQLGSEYGHSVIEEIKSLDESSRELSAVILNLCFGFDPN